jgi:hypothetical protein
MTDAMQDEKRNLSASLWLIVNHSNSAIVSLAWNEAPMTGVLKEDFEFRENYYKVIGERKEAHFHLDEVSTVDRFNGDDPVIKLK